MDFSSFINAKGRFSSLEWTFIERLELSMGIASLTIITFGCGPHIQWYLKEDDRHGETIAFGSPISIFEKTGTYVRGAVNLSTKSILVWGGAYIADIPIDKLMQGGEMGPENILSTGREIVRIKVLRNYPTPIIFEIYFADGVVQTMAYTWNGNRNARPTIGVQKAFRLPLKVGEKITVVNTRKPETYLGTNQGRLMAIKDSALLSTIDTKIKSPIKQIVTSAAVEIMLIVYENGSLASRRDANQISLIQGRYTSICESILTFPQVNTGVENYFLAGDRDGNVTSFKIKKGKVEKYRVTRNLTLNPITAMQLIGQTKVIVGTNMGELQWFDVTLLGQIPVDTTIPPVVAGSDSHYRSYFGWNFIKDGNISRFIKSIGKKKLKQKMATYYHIKDSQMKYLVCTGSPDREILFAYRGSEFYANITDFTSKQRQFTQIGHFKTPKESLTVTQVILMQSHVLVQTTSEMAKLMYIDVVQERLQPVVDLVLSKRITAAACIQKPGATRTSLLDLMVAYLDGTVGVRPIKWKGQKAFNIGSTTIPVDLRGGYIVSMISSHEHIGESSCIFLSNKGKAYLASEYDESDKNKYRVILEQDLSTIIGRGHSLMETSYGILAAGFKKNTLHVCLLSLNLKETSLYSHLFSVETRSSRLPFSIIEDKSALPTGGRGTEDNVIVCYHQKNGPKEERFPLFAPQVSDGIRHSGIITSCWVRDTVSDGKKYLYTGDVNGRFCIWFLDEQAMNAQKVSEYKVNGAITSICRVEDHVAVSTSLGDLHLYAMFVKPKIQILPLLPHNMGQKINCVTEIETWDDERNLGVVFLADGTVKKLEIEGSDTKYTVDDVIHADEMVKFPVATKEAFSIVHKKDYCITALGIDGILRRWYKNRVTQLDWKLSTVKYDVDEVSKTLVAGDQDGWVYFLFTHDHVSQPYFFIDQIHKCEVIDISIHYSRENGLSLATLDRSGVVVIRKIDLLDGLSKPKNRPVIWASPVPSPRKLAILEDRKIMVLGKGVATKSF